MRGKEERQKLLMLIGRSGAGKTTLCQRIRNEELRYSKTQTINIRGGGLIDTPGEYLENRRLQCALAVTSVEADVIGIVQDATDAGTMYPEAYAAAFAKPVVGIITKSDLAGAEAVRRAEELLVLAGAEKVFAVSSITGEGIDALLRYLSSSYLVCVGGE